MFSVKQGSKPVSLDAWGTVADLGSVILEGEVKAFGKITFGAPDSAISAGYFACTQGKFRMVYPFNEHATVIEGRVTLVDEATGVAASYEPGDSWFIAKGTPILWHVTSATFTKHYMAAA